EENGFRWLIEHASHAAIPLVEAARPSKRNGAFQCMGEWVLAQVADSPDHQQLMPDLEAMTHPYTDEYTHFLYKAHEHGQDPDIDQIMHLHQLFLERPSNIQAAALL